MTPEERLLEGRARLSRLGVRHRGRPVPFGITAEPFSLPAGVGERIRRAGALVGRFLARVDALCLERRFAGLRRAIPELACLNRPESAHLRRRSARTGVPAAMFRLDLLVEPSGGIKICEIELLFGGIGYTDVLREQLFRDPRAFSAAYARMLGFLCGGPRRCALVAADAPVLRPYLDDLRLFVERVGRHHPRFELLFASDLRCDADGNLCSVADPEPIRLVHRFFELYQGLGEGVPGFEHLERAQALGTTQVLPALKQHLEEKLAMALAFHPRLEGFFPAELRSLLPRTWLLAPDAEVAWEGRPLAVTPERGRALLERDLFAKLGAAPSRAALLDYARDTPCLLEPRRGALIGALGRRRRVGPSDLVGLARELRAAACLPWLPARRRAFVLKLSGFEELAAESKSVVFLTDLGGAAVARTIEVALASGKTWVLQELVPQARFSAQGLMPRYRDLRDPDELDPASLAWVAYPSAYARVEPHYCLTGADHWELAEVAVTLTPDKRAHGRTDAFLTVASF